MKIHIIFVSLACVSINQATLIGNKANLIGNKVKPIGNHRKAKATTKQWQSANPSGPQARTPKSAKLFWLGKKTNNVANNCDPWISSTRRLSLRLEFHACRENVSKPSTYVRPPVAVRLYRRRRKKRGGSGRGGSPLQLSLFLLEQRICSKQS